MSKVFHMPHKRNSGRIIVDEYDQRKREREEYFVCHFCQDEIPSRLMAEHRNVCAIEEVPNQPLVEGKQQKKNSILFNHSAYTHKENKNIKQQTPRKLASLRKYARDNYSVASQKKSKLNKASAYQNNSIKNGSLKKQLKESSRKQSISKRKSKQDNLNNAKQPRKYMNNLQKRVENKSFVAQEYKQYFGQLNKRKGLSKIKKQIKNAWIQHSYKNSNKCNDPDKKKQLEKLHKQKLKRIEQQAQRLKKQQEQLIKQYQRQKKKEKRQGIVNRSQIKRQPKPRFQMQNQKIPNRNRKNQTRINHERAPQTNQRRHQRYPTAQESYYQQIPINNPHRTLNFISHTINEQFQMMKQQFEHMNQFFSNFVPFSNNGFVYFERGEESDYSLDSSSESVGYEEEPEQGLYQQQIEMLPRYVYSKRLGVDDQCAVCISSIKHNETVRRLPCHHVFHSQCIDQWLKRKAACPVCRDQIDDLVQ